MINQGTALRDNRRRGRAGDWLQGVIRPGSKLSVVSAYFTSAAYSTLDIALDPVDQLRFLFGEPRFIAQVQAETLNPPSFSITDEGLALASQLRQASEARRCAAWLRSKAEIRSVRRHGLLHGKLFHVHDGAREHAMVGSSNFTLAGLGYGPEPNLELNLVVDGDRDRHDLLAWFDEIWSDETLTVDVKGEVLRILERLHARHSPEFVYHKTLFHLFEADLAAQAAAEEALERSRFTETAVWRMLYPFQQDGVRAVLAKLDRHGGCVLADSVGLGKTLTALAVIKHYELRNKNVLVLCPKKLRENWTEYLQHSDFNPLREDRLAYKVMSHTDLGRRTGRVGDQDLRDFRWSAFDLVVIDESHAFRNAGGGRYDVLMEQVLKAGAQTRVLLLSATPVNNDFADLKAQLDLIGQGRPDAFRDAGAPSLPALIGDARRKFASWLKAGGGDPSALVKSLPPALTTLLDGVTIARSRRHVECHYAESMAKIGRFPERARPESLFPGVDAGGAFPSYDEVDRIVGALNLALYNPFAFVRAEHKARYDARDRRTAGFNQANRERYLVAMMKIGFLKRLESSVASFRATMDRMLARIDARLAEIEAFKVSGTATSTEAPEPDELARDDDELAGAFEVGGKLRYDLAHMDAAAWAEALRRDRDRVAELAAAARAVVPERDAKLAELRAIVERKLTEPTPNRDGPPNRKLILFTAFADTARYLYEALAPVAASHGAHTGLVTGDGARATAGTGRFQEVLTNFSPRSKKRRAGELAPEIDLLIATDCISEGQNLQDADLVVNVDVHWNPVRLIQRFGRIDRLGSAAEKVRMVNFWPTPDLARYLNVKDRVEARMTLVDLAAGGDDNLLADARDAAAEEVHWRDAQLKRLQEEVFDLEEASEGLSLSEFTLEDFRADLLAYARANEQALREAPAGLHALVPAEAASGRFEPGVVFCLRRAGAVGDKSVNPLEPYYLIYVRDDGTVRNGFTQPKSILTALAALCVGQSEPFDALCDAWDAQTDHGRELAAYDALARAAVDDVAKAYAVKALAGLAAGRGGKLGNVEAQARAESRYELITWLIVRPGAGA